MALLNEETVIKKVLAGLAKTGVGQGYEVLSYKRNRGVDIIRTGPDTARVRERGYREQEMAVSLESLPRLLEAIFRHEFPRSTKLRLYQIRSPEQLDQPRKKL
ncbi:MAG: hypothetical protein ACOY3Z_03270 [Thermodesulfobacteriota bacterium]